MESETEVNNQTTTITIRKQLRNNAVALVSIFIAVSSLAYNTWRNETTEEQRNVRHAAFRVLESLGELQGIVDARYYYLPFEPGNSSESETRIRGFGNVAMIRDLTSLMPQQAKETGATLNATWLKHFALLDRLDPNGKHAAEAKTAEEKLTQAIRGTRAAVLEVLARLD